MFDISNDAADWIQDNLYLIDDGDLQQIVKKCPAKIVGEVLLAMDDVGAEIKEDPNSTEMWGIKSSDGDITLSLGKHNKTNYNVNFTASEGMRGGMQIGFKSVNDCIQFIKKFGQGAEYYRPSRMQPKTVDEYTWQEVDTIYGKCWVTNLAFHKYDPASAARNRKLNKANKEIIQKQLDWITDNIDFNQIALSVSSAFGLIKNSRGEEVTVEVEPIVYRSSWCLSIYNVNTNDAKKLTEIVSLTLGYNVILLDAYIPDCPSSYLHNKITISWFQPDTPEFNAIKDDIYAKYGL